MGSFAEELKSRIDAALQRGKAAREEASSADREAKL